MKPPIQRQLFIPFVEHKSTIQRYLAYFDVRQYSPSLSLYHFISGPCFHIFALLLVPLMPRLRNLKEVSWLSPQRQTSKDSCSPPPSLPPLPLLAFLFLSITGKLFSCSLPAPPLQTHHISSPSVLCPYKALLLSSPSTHSFSFIYLQ